VAQLAVSFLKLRRRAALIDFWDSTCVNSIHTVPSAQAWYDRYRDKGLSVMGFTRGSSPLPDRNPMSMAPHATLD
jgi:hypothetical protein